MMVKKRLKTTESEIQSVNMIKSKYSRCQKLYRQSIYNLKLFLHIHTSSIGIKNVKKAHSVTVLNSSF